jgi:hypothetical protein
MPHTQAFIFGDEACPLRLKRHVSFASPAEREAGAGHDGWVCVVEQGPDQYEEMDARSQEHAIRLACDSVDMGWARTASVQMVHADGSIRCMGIYSEQTEQYA